MNNISTPESTSLEWLQFMNNATKKSGIFHAKDTLGNSIILEWEKINPQSPRLSDKIISVCDLLVEAYSNIEIQFAKKYPELIPNEMFLKSLESYFKEGIDKVDWDLVEIQLKENLKQFLTMTDWPKYSGPNDIHFFVVAKDAQTNIELGMIQLIATPEYLYGNFKVALYDGVLANGNNRNLQILLLSAIFKLVPSTTRLFLHTRITNESGIQVHRELGFTPFPGDLPHWIDLEYKSDHKNILQNIAKTFFE